MNFSIVTLTIFDKRIKRLAKKYKSIRKDFIAFVENLKENPFIGADLSNGVRKVRMAISDKGKGKSGGARIITYVVKTDEESGQVTLLTIYDKNEQETISQKEINALLTEIG